MSLDHRKFSACMSAFYFRFDCALCIRIMSWCIRDLIYVHFCLSHRPMDSVYGNPKEANRLRTFNLYHDLFACMQPQNHGPVHTRNVPTLESTTFTSPDRSSEVI